MLNFVNFVDFGNIFFSLWIIVTLGASEEHVYFYGYKKLQNTILNKYYTILPIQDTTKCTQQNTLLSSLFLQFGGGHDSTTIPMLTKCTMQPTLLSMFIGSLHTIWQGGHDLECQTHLLHTNQTRHVCIMEKLPARIVKPFAKCSFAVQSNELNGFIFVSVWKDKSTRIYI